MKIETNPLNDLYKVIEPSVNVGDIYLSSEVIQYLENHGKLESLGDMQFYVSESNQEWEISDQAPVGTLGTSASLIFYVQGVFHQKKNKIVCTID